ncbi:MAG: hypothetical protein DRP97_06370 [Candidatus Latescibacterota bacterium]|nr:MAG: hypothetical protein DRP97_06370 [Candidatus Latescibacterota bacterium]
MKKGDRVRCKIDGTPVNDAKIQEENGRFYICQNERDGFECEDKLGYDYSWGIDDGSKNAIRDAGVTDFCLLLKEKG